MKITSTFAFLAAAASFLSQSVVHAQTAGWDIAPTPLSTPINAVNMVCHESGGSGEPLTDYVNNVDVSYGTPGGKFPGNLPIIYTETNPAPNGLPTSCAAASAILSELGLKLKESFSHFPGYYVEIFST